MQTLETTRLDTLKYRLNKFASLLTSAQIERKLLAEELKKSVDNMNTNQDINTFIEDCRFNLIFIIYFIFISNN